jgi:hypothetical protein
LIKNDRTSVVFDSMLYAGISLFVVSIILKLEYYYYYSPTIVLIAPAIIYYSIKIIGHKFTLLVVIIFFSLYFYKISTSVSNILGRRQTEYVKVKEIATHLNKGYKIYWFEVETNDLKNQNTIYRNWSRDLIRDHLRFNLYNEDFEIKTIYQLERNSKTIYLVSTLNEKLDAKNYKMQIDGLHNQKSFSLGDIDIYISE